MGSRACRLLGSSSSLDPQTWKQIKKHYTHLMVHTARYGLRAAVAEASILALLFHTSRGCEHKSLTVATTRAHMSRAAFLLEALLGRVEPPRRFMESKEPCRAASIPRSEPAHELCGAGSWA